MFSEARRIANTREHFSCILTWLRATEWPTHATSQLSRWQHIWALRGRIRTRLVQHQSTSFR